jgi:hypothetical protein
LPQIKLQEIISEREYYVVYVAANLTLERVTLEEPVINGIFEKYRLEIAKFG